MLEKSKQKEKTYEQFMEEALLKIPLYVPTWTNFQKADPGITILENLSAFSVIQQETILRDNEEVFRSLLKLSDIEAAKGQCAHVLLEVANVSEELIIPEKQKFQVGDLIFETEQPEIVSIGKITGIFTQGDKWVDNSGLLEENNMFPLEIFTEKPKKDMELYIFFEDIPEGKKELIFYAKIFDEYRRTPGKEAVAFATIRWQCYTKSGFKDIQVEDDTKAFLFDGKIIFHLGELVPQNYSKAGQKGYVLRGILERADYDNPPKLMYMRGFLLDVVQKETKSMLKVFEDTNQISLYSDILEEEYYKIYTSNEEDGFHVCEKEEYQVKHDGYGMYTFVFSEVQKQILIVAYTVDIMYSCNLGTVYGYDEEIISLPEKNVLADNFSLLAEVIDGRGNEVRYYVLYPGETNATGFYYDLDEENGQVCIQESGRLTGCNLYIGEIVITQGKNGNIRSGQNFEPVGYQTTLKFCNVAPGEHGRTTETIEELCQRFAADVNQGYTAVTRNDYERIVKEIPGLCIDKVAAYRNEQDDSVSVVVKPKGAKKFPRLSVPYKKLITKKLEERRLLNVSVKLENPIYIPILVSGEIYVKDHYIDAEKMIKETIFREIDYLQSEKSFGEVLKFDKVFRAVETLECVETVGVLSILPENLGNVRLEGVDIHPAPNGLLYLKEVRMELNPFDIGIIKNGKGR